MEYVRKRFKFLSNVAVHAELILLTSTRFYYGK
jgi:hypothetical protein